MTQTKSEAAIRGISLVRRIGSLITFFVLTAIIVSVTYGDIRDRFRISGLKEMYARGESKHINKDVEFKIERFNYKTTIRIDYKFPVDGKIYTNQYVLHSNLPQDPVILNKIFTVHYLKNNPDNNCLNIESEIRYVEQKIAKSSIFWLIIKCIGVVIFLLFFLMQIFGLIGDLKNINKPIETPAYLKK